LRCDFEVILDLFDAGDLLGGGHDLRYSVNHGKISRELGYEPLVPFDRGLADTIAWYRENRDWWEPLKARSAIDR